MKVLFCLVLLSFLINPGANVPGKSISIYVDKSGDKNALFAAREIRKYVYQRTGFLLPIIECDENMDLTGDAIIVGYLARRIQLPETNLLSSLESDAYVIKTVTNDTGKKLIICGGSNVGTLYAAYRFAETMGIGFYLEGDVIPDKQIPFIFPKLDIKEKPLFALRGILPFHDFPEGPDWWNESDYKAIISQLVKLRMNFIGMHTYPEGGVGPEPLVWIGPRWNVESNGRVKSSYSSSYFTTSDGDPGGWGYEPMKTSEYCLGASQLFENDLFGADYMIKFGSSPKSFIQQNELFNTFGSMLNDVFTFSKNFGVKTCIGTESPLTIPKSVRDHFKLLGKDIKDSAVIKEIYEGIFERIKLTHPLDYYWIWTPEELMTEFPDEKLQPIINDLKFAEEAIHNVGAPFSLATCGWTLGPPKDRAMFDKILPKDVAVSTISLIGGKEPLQFGFAAIKDRPKWAIPWLEDDSRMIVPQLYAGRMRKDAADALAYQCTGLMGIHWRTRILSPNISALAKAAWDQHGWNPDFPDHIKMIDHTQDTIRDLDVKDFYREWAGINFGDEQADAIASVFVRLDGITNLKEKKDKLPKPAFWQWGPGGIRPDARPWETVSKDYQFANDLEALLPGIKGSGNIERFEYWVNQFKYISAMARFNCTWGLYEKEYKKLLESNNPNEQKTIAKESLLPIRIKMVGIMNEIQNYMTPTISNNGELGVLCNWQQHILPRVFRDPGLILEKYLGSALPDSALLQKDYNGQPHIVVTTNRGSLYEGESLNVKVRSISPVNVSPVKTEVFWRTPGDKSFHSKDLEHISRGVYELKINNDEFNRGELEYYVQFTFRNGDVKRFPASAPSINQYVTIIPD